MKRRLLRWFAFLFLISLNTAVIALAVIYFRTKSDLRFRYVSDYRPPASTHVRSFNGDELFQITSERRTVVAADEIPDVVKKAVVAAEDATFYEHRGVRPLAIARCAVRILLPGRAPCGGSSITQQVIKTIVLPPPRTSRVRRKILDIPFAYRLEQLLSKDVILNRYLNQVYFGHQRYGIEEAAQFYFAKHASDLTLGEAATLAGVIQSPETLSPMKHPVAAKDRQAYVLRRMMEEGFITHETMRAEIDRPIVVAAQRPDFGASWYADAVRAELFETLGEDAVRAGGYQVQVAMDPVLQRAAEATLRNQLTVVDRRLGWRGTGQRVDLADAVARSELAGWRLELEVLQLTLQMAALDVAQTPQKHADLAGALVAKLRKHPNGDVRAAASLPRAILTVRAWLDEDGGTYTRIASVLADYRKSDDELRTAARSMSAEAKAQLAKLDRDVRRRIESLAARRKGGPQGGASRDADARGDDVPLLVWDLPATNADRARAEAGRKTRVPFKAMKAGESYRGVVTAVGDAVATVDLGSVSGVVRLQEFGWKLRVGAQPGATAPVRSLRAVLRRGDVVGVRLPGGAPVPTAGGKGRSIALVLEQVPEVQGALVALDVETRGVRALVGGYDHAVSAFDRARSARRQPGSAFKPFVWGAALESRRYTPATVVEDAPFTYRDPSTRKEWTPHNFERDGFDGPMSLRAALAFSKNTVAARLIDTIGVRGVSEFARRCGIESKLPQTPSLALGVGEVTPLELVNAYATIAANGRARRPVFILGVRDRSGRSVWPTPPDVSTPPIHPPVAFVLADMMRDVTEYGTGKPAMSLGRSFPGKTGTTQDFRDAWFVGFLPATAAGVWVGFDSGARLGPEGTGANTALPAWVEFMRHAARRQRTVESEEPPGVEFATMSEPARRAPRPTRVSAFVEGTAPTGIQPTPNESAPTKKAPTRAPQARTTSRALARAGGGRNVP